MDYTKVDVVDHYSGQEGDLQKFDIVYDSATKSGGGEDYREKSLSLLKQDESNHGKIQLHGCSVQNSYFRPICRNQRSCKYVGKELYNWPKEKRTLGEDVMYFLNQLIFPPHSHKNLGDDQDEHNRP